MISINLLPDVKIEYLKTQSIKHRFISLAVIVSIVAIGSLVLVAIYVKVIQPVQFSKTQKSVKKLSSKLSTDQGNLEVATLQNQLKALNEINSTKPAMSRIFNYLQSIIPKAVQLSSIQVDSGLGTITIQASADSLKTANVFSDTLKYTNFEYKDASQNKQSSTAFSSVQFNELGKSDSEKGVSFSVNFKYDSKFFDSTITSVVLKTPALSTSQINQPNSNGKKNSSEQNTTPFGDDPAGTGTPANVTDEGNQ